MNIRKEREPLDKQNDNVIQTLQYYLSLKKVLLHQAQWIHQDQIAYRNVDQYNNVILQYLFF